MHRLTSISAVFFVLFIAACAVPVVPLPLESPVSQSADGEMTATEEPVIKATAEVATTSISGIVSDDRGPVQGATVRIRNTKNETLTDRDGAFVLADLEGSDPMTLTVTAWSLGYYGGSAEAKMGDGDVEIEIKPYHITDNIDYEFVSAKDCGECHTNYDEWSADAHAQSANNHRFLTMYSGTDVHGNKQKVRRDAAGLPLQPEPGEPYYGPGLRLDYPDRTGNCAACHTPSVSKIETSNTCGWSGCHTNFTAQMSDQIPYGINPTALSGAAAEGMTCDFCHKIGNVILNAETQLPHAARPGVTSLQIFRPDEGHDLFLGTFDDVPGKDSYLPLQEESAFCASCHFGVFGGVAGSHDMAGGVLVYNSYGEWLESPYSNPETGQTCQECHMPSTDYEYFVYPDKGGLPRDPDRIHNHLMPGIGDADLMQNAVTMSTEAQTNDGELTVTVSVNNDNTGHHVPTGTPLRSMMLVVTATDSQGNVLPLAEGDVLPDWTGEQAGLPGRAYAKILEDKWTGEAPTGAYWRDIELIEDTRLPAYATDISTYRFESPDTGPVTINTQLLYRRAFQKLAEEKGWTDPDIIMQEETLVVDGA